MILHYCSLCMVMKRSMTNSAVLIPILLLLAATISLGFCYGCSSAGCRPSEKGVLLKFKNDLTDPSNRLASWVSDEDCCRWSGVVCNNLTGHVLELHLGNHYPYKENLGGKISPSLLNLKHLRYLDLSNNDFGGIHIPKFLGSMRNLRYLSLSDSGFGRKIPHELGNLSTLHHLNLQGNEETYADNLHWLSGLSLLEFLDLSNVDLSKAFDWLEVINSFPSLAELRMSSCLLPQVSPLLNVNFSSLSILDLSFNSFSFSFFPGWIFRIKSLVYLELSGNDFQGPLFGELQNLTALRELGLSSNGLNSSIPDWLYSFSHLEVLNLDDNSFQGKISSVIGNLTSLTSLDLSSNQLEGRIPKSLKMFCKLRSVDLSDITLNQEINEVFEILSGCIADRLEELDLSFCQLFGHLTISLSQFKRLTSLDLGNNNISGPFPVSIGELPSLRSLGLDTNKLNGTPPSFRKLEKLEEVDISYNLLEGDIFEHHFPNHTSLQIFFAMGNQLILRVSHDWIPPLGLASLGLRSWHIGPQFPSWLCLLKSLGTLDLSNSSISDTIPICFWNISSELVYLDLSHNQIFGKLPNVLEFVPSSLIDLSSNRFEGEPPQFSSSPSFLDLSNNSFSGSMSSFLCYKMDELKNTEILNLGENHLSGEVPDCWINWKKLVGIKLSNNNFSGDIPNSLGSLVFLQSLHLDRNRLSGEIPSWLKNCTTLVTLDLGENELVGNIPAWIGESLSGLLILNLNRNKFEGYIPKEICLLDSLQILNLARNNLSGIIPSCIHNFSARNGQVHLMGDIEMYGGPDVLMEQQSLVLKGRQVEYSANLYLVKCVDLSDNKLSGEIPKEITSLVGLQFLNLTQNLLIGRIPEDIGAMRSLESLDLSRNQLSGKIPQSMSSLTFLSFLNLSYNKLSGKIPSGTQLQSFDASSFMGNELCGPPLPDCSINSSSPDIKNGRAKHGLELEMDCFYTSMILGFVVGFLSIVGPLLVNRQWRHGYFHFFDRLKSKIL